MFSEEELINYVKSQEDLDAIVVEGYDGVGKGRILNILSEALGVTPYRPNYNHWQKYDHRPIDRWKVSGFFWDVFSHFMQTYPHLEKPMLFDRGVMSGAVYNNDVSIAESYKDIIRDRNILHILVLCDKEDYLEFNRVRFNNLDSYNQEELWEDYLKYTKRYKDYLSIAGVDSILYTNHFNKDISDLLSVTCEGCGHYSYGYCMHPSVGNNKVDPRARRCEYSNDIEVQDMVVSN